MKTNFQEVEQFFLDIKSGKLKVVAGDETQKAVSAQMVIIQKYLAEHHELVIPDNKLYSIAEDPDNAAGKIWIPVVCSSDAYLARLEKTPGVKYNYAKDNNHTLAKAFGFDRRSNGLYLMLVNDSIEPDTDLRMSWNVKTEQKPLVDCERITEYMAHFDYILHTRKQQLDSGNTWTRTESLYSFADDVANGYSRDGGFKLVYNVRGNTFANGGFRAVSKIALVS